MGFHPAADAALERSLDAMRKAGAEIVDVELPTAGQWNDAEMDVLLYEFKHGVNSYLARSGGPVNSLAALIEFNRRNDEDRNAVLRAGTVRTRAGQGHARRDRPTSTRAARPVSLAGADGLDATLAASQLDAIVAPATAPAWLIDPLNGDHFLGEGYGAAAVAGTPSITVPMGDYFGLPLGLVFMGPALERAAPDRAGLRVRTEDARAQAADVRRQRAAGQEQGVTGLAAWRPAHGRIVACLLSAAAVSVLSLLDGGPRLADAACPRAFPVACPPGTPWRRSPCARSAGAAVLSSRPASWLRGLSWFACAVALAWLPVSILMAGNPELNFANGRGDAWIALSLATAGVVAGSGLLVACAAVGRLLTRGRTA